MSKLKVDILSKPNPLEELDQWISKRLFLQIRQLGVFTGPDNSSGSVEDLRAKAGVLDKYARWWKECCLEILERHGYVRHENGQVVFSGHTALDGREAERAFLVSWEARKAAYLQDPQSRAVVQLIDECLQHLPDILRGAVLATDIIFPNASLDKVEGIYKHNERADFFNMQVAETAKAYLALLVAQRPEGDIRIIEIGAGTGGTAAIVLPHIAAFQSHIREYCYTDISNAFLVHGKTQYGADYPFLTCRLWNIEEPPAQQNIDLGAYDVVIATNVLHATKNIRETLRNAKAVMKKNGILLLNELTEKSLFGTLTFGLLDGWWRYEDEELRIHGSPLLDVESWRSVLRQEGFGSIFIPEPDAGRLGQQVLVAESDGVIRQRVAPHQAEETAIKRLPVHQPEPQRPPAPVKIADRPVSPISAAVSAADIEVHVLSALADALKVSGESIKKDVPFADYGVDSILGVNFVNRLKDVLAISLNTAIIFDYSTVDRLTKYILQNHRDEIAERLGQASAQTAGPEDDAPVEDGLYDIDQTAPVTSLPPASSSAWEERAPQADVSETTAAGNAASRPDDIAIVGISGQFPEAEDVESFWQNLIEGRDGVVELPAEYLDRERYFSEVRQSGKTYCRWGGILKDRASFDPLFFSLSPREAESMNPHQRLILQESWKGLEDAGYDPKTLSDRQVGVFVGAEPVRYAASNFTGASEALVASRLSYYLNLKGPALAVNTGCSSSGVAIHLACESLRNHETDMALAGGVHAALDRLALVSTSEIEMLSPRGRCHTLDASGDGTVLSEGVGIVVLKRLNDAVADKDHIYGVIKASGINQDGASNGITAPNGAAQEELITSVYQRYQINPADIGYVELHGTGTRLGDPIEANALVRAFKKFTVDQDYCGLGSAKSHIGHASAAAGVIGLIKVLLSMKHGQLPGLMHFKELNPLIDLKGTAFNVVSQTRPWIAKNGKRRLAALNSFGHSGTNVHLVIEDYPRPDVSDAHDGQVLIPLSAANADRLKAYARKLLAFVGKDNFGPAELQRTAYTLQTGREMMRHRVAFVVGTVAELIENLTRFVSAGESAGDFLYADIRNPPAHLKLSLSDDDAGDMIRKWTAKRELKKLAQIWVAGATMDWLSLYDGRRLQRMPLPTYPFVKDRYWRTAEDVPQPVVAAPQPAVLHPLLHTDVSSGDRQGYRSTFSGQELFLADHKIQGRIILPGVAHLELVRAAIEHAAGAHGDGRFVQLKNVVWIQPIVVETPRQISVVLSSAPQDQIDFEIHSHDRERKTVHCRGRASTVAGPEPHALRLQEQLARMRPSGIDMEDFYAAFRRVEIFHGPFYRGVTGLHRDDAHVLAKLALPAVVADSQGDYVLHPSLMESALQAASLLIADSKQHAGGPSLPFALESIDIHGACTSEMYAWVRYASDYPQNGNVIKLDVDLTDMQGRVRVRLRGFSFRRLGEEPAVPSQSTDKAAGLILAPAWRAASPATGQMAHSYARRHLVLCDMPEADAAQLQASLPDARCQALSSSQHNLAERFTQHALSCFELIRSFAASRPEGKVLVQIVVPDDGESRALAGLSGLLKTAALEHPFICGQILLTPPGVAARDLAEQLQAGANAPQDVVIKYRQGQRLVLDWEEVRPQGTLSNILLKDQGVYLITGGFGGIGLIFARDILRQTANARVILTGRSALNPEKQAQLAGLQRQSNRIDYLQSDVSDIGQVRALVERIGKQYRQLNGIIHSAGIISDELIGKKSAAEFEKVLAAKVTGTVNLDLATQDLGLDFLVLFSSMSAVFGNPGQADYATGNAFMDAFAAHRNELASEGKRSGRTLSLNWPLWEEGGMALSDTHKALMRQAMGAWPLPTLDGLTAFYHGLNSGYGQLLVLYGATDRLKKFVSLGEAPQPVPAAMAAGATTEKTTGKPGSLHDIQKLLVEEVAGAIQLAPDKLELDVEFSQYGFDSIVLMDFVRDLNQKYGLELMPTVFFEYSTINAFAAYLDREHRDVLARHLAIAADAEPPAVSQVVQPARSSPAANFGFDPHAPAAVSEFPGRFQDIAIIGMDGTFPEAAGVDAFWEAIRTRKDMMKEIPLDHWDYRPWFEEDREIADKTYCKWGSFIDGVDRFDAEFFNISPKEAEWMDPQMRLLLQSVYRCGEDAGLINEIRGSKTGVFVGACSHDYMDRIAELNGPINPHQGVGNAPTVIANRVSFLLNLTGPSLAFNTACSASLVALHEACHSLQRQECQMAFVGGVNLLLSSHHYRYFSSIGALSPTGRSYSFDARADGYVPGETIASILLKPLAQAARDGDRIYAVVKGSAALHGGFTPSITAPSVSGEKNVIVSAWKNAGIDPSTLGYIEAHGTGTKLGDPIEVSALTQAFQEFTPQTAFCALGSAKAHLGHTEGSAGIVGVIKVIEQIRHGEIPAMPFYEELNPYIQLGNSALYINRENIRWEAPRNHPRRAGVSSFGFSGVYAHVVLEEYIDHRHEQRSPWKEDGGPNLIVLSAKTRDRLDARITDLLDFLMQDGTASLTEIAYTLQVGREAMKERLGFVASSKEELQRTLQACLDEQRQPDGVYRGVAKGNLRSLSNGIGAEELDRLIGQWTNPAASAELLRSWVNGQPVEWERLYGMPKPRRIRLPAYPFVGERYWLEPVSADRHLPPTVSTAQAPVPSPVRKLEPIPATGRPDLQQHTLAVLTGLISEATKIPAHRIGADADFEELGLDSILIAALNKQLEKWTGNTDATLFFKYKTLASLADYLTVRHAAVIEDARPEGTRATTPSAVAAGADPVRSPAADTKSAVSVSPQPRQQPPADDDIAIIGMSGRYPGAKDLKTFWQNLCEATDSIVEIPEERFDYRPLFHSEKGLPGKLYCKWGGFIDDVDQFDAGFFKLSPQDVRFMDPQERIFLETAWDCLETAGHIGPQWQRKARNIGVFAGVTFNNYQLIMAEAAEAPAYLANSQTFSIANRVSYFFNFTGPSFTVDTACSSSLLAIHQACESLKRSECELALAGGVNLSLHPSKYLTLCATSFASSDGRCHAFAANGDGYVPSEGVGAILLKPYRQALADGDPILAIIKGTGVSHDGKTQGYTVPNPVAQSKAIEVALRQAGISPEHISYVEAHGTGTTLGDPIEIQGLMDVYSQYTDRTQYCAIGSVKSNIGHGEAAAGIAQLTKTVLQLQHKTLVPSLLHDRLNPNIDFERTAFYVQREKAAWAQPINEGKAHPRYAGISSFGAGGVNVHVILEEAPEQSAPSEALDPGRSLVIPLSAHMPEQLPHLAANLYRWLLDEAEHDWRFEEIAHTLQTRRALFPHRLAFVAAGKTELLAVLKAYLERDGDVTAGQDWYETSVGQGNGFDLDLSAEEDRDYLRSLLNRGRPEKLALLWVNGTNIPWEDLYAREAGLRCVPLPAYAFAKKRYWIGRDVPEKIDASPDPVRDDVAVETLISDAVFDVQWSAMALDRDLAQTQIPIGNLMVISEDPAMFETRRWGRVRIQTCLIGDDVQQGGQYDVILGRQGLDYRGLLERIRSGGIGCLVYVPSRIDIETCSYEELDRHLRWESQKLHRWMAFLIGNLVETPPKVVFLSLAQPAEQDPVHALLSKYFSFLRYEYPEFQASIIKVDSLSPAIMEQVLAEIESRSDETEVAFQGQERQVQRLIPIALADPERDFDASGCMVISGGFGGIGFKVLQWLVDKGTTELIVIGRKPVTAILQHPDLDAPISIEALTDKLGRQGVMLHYMQVDIDQPDQLAETFDKVRKKLRQPITGVFHLAGITTDAIPLSDMTEDRLIEVISPKLVGAYALDRVTADDPLRYFCLFSSTSSVEGMQVNGLGAYAAANASLDAVAALRQRRNQPVQLIHWTDWDEVGMAVAHGHKAFMDAVGIHMLSPSAGLSVLEAMLIRSIPSSTVFHVDWEKFSRINRAIRKLPFFAEYVRAMDRRHAPPTGKAASVANGEADKPIDIAAIYPNTPASRQGHASREALVARLSGKLAAMMEVKAVSPEANLSDLGLDSINSIQYFKEVSAELSMDVSPSVTFRYPTISKLADYLLSQIPTRHLDDAPAEDADFSVARQLQAALRRSEKLLTSTE